MKKYKENLKKRVLYLSIGLISYVIANLIMYVNFGINANQDTADFILGFQFGIGIFILGLLICFIINYITGLRNEDKLKKMYIADTDERMLMIYQKSGSTGMTIAILGLAASAVLAAYINTTVFFTLLGACFFVAVIRGILKLYYRNKL